MIEHDANAITTEVDPRAIDAAAKIVERRNRLAPLMSSARTNTGSDSWCTPSHVLDLVRAVGPIGLDPCWNENALTFPHQRFTEAEDGLPREWTCEPGEVVFCNPPYSNIRDWLGKCDDEWRARHNECTIALVPARTDTRAFHNTPPLAICFWKGRITFVGAKAPAPFPSALLCWARGEMLERFCSTFASVGMVVTL